MEEARKDSSSLVGKRFVRSVIGEAYLEKLFRAKRVAIYVRVSRKSDMSHHSIDAQMTHLKEFVLSRPNWELVDVYMDYGVTGTKINRPEFNRMLQDARDGKIDIIYTKSASRFGRNLGATLKVIHELSRLDIEIIFENDNVHVTNDAPYSLFVLQFKLLQAEMTARELSENQKWSVRNRFKNGIAPSNNRLYGYRPKGRELQVDQKEAVIVKRIFDMYLSGKGRNAICKQLNSEGIPSPTGNKWRQSTIAGMLTNEKYIGDMLLQKTFVKDPLTKQKQKNRGELERYYIKNDHEAIIDRAIFSSVQKEISRRSEVYKRGVTQTDHRPSLSFTDINADDIFGEMKRREQPPRKLFHHILYCPYCDTFYYHSRIPSGKKYRELWQCRDYVQLGSSYCPNKSIREDILVRHTNDILLEKGLIKRSGRITNELISKYIKKIVCRKDQVLEYCMWDGEIIVKHWRYDRHKSWTPEMREKARQTTLRRLALGRAR